MVFAKGKSISAWKAFYCCHPVPSLLCINIVSEWCGQQDLKKLLVRIPKLPVNGTTSYRHLTEFLLSSVKTGSNEDCLKKVLVSMRSFPVFFHHTKRLSFCLPVIHVLGWLYVWWRDLWKWGQWVTCIPSVLWTMPQWLFITTLKAIIIDFHFHHKQGIGLNNLPRVSGEKGTHLQMLFSPQISSRKVFLNFCCVTCASCLYHQGLPF